MSTGGCNEEVTMYGEADCWRAEAIDAGSKVEDVCREHGISSATYYNWKSKCGGMEASDLRRMKDLEEENARLKRMFADLSLTPPLGHSSLGSASLSMR